VTCKANASLAGPKTNKCKCNAGYTPNPDAANCVYTGCHAYCKTCDGKEKYHCLTCHSNASIVGGTGPAECKADDGYYDNPGPDNATPCHKFCKTCSGGSENECTSCFINASLKSGNPGPCTCDTGFYEMDDVANCSLKNCHETCETCVGTAIDQCKSCFDNAHIDGESPARCLCNDGYYLSGATCVPCYKTCMTCENGTINGCNSCFANASLKGLAPSACNCDSGFTANPDESNCEVLPKCHVTCKTCTGSGINDCVTCKDHALIDGGVAPNRCICFGGYY
jgi:hypothetical protein